MLRLINFILSFCVLAAVIVGGKWYSQTAQPVRFDNQIAFIKDTALFEMERYGQPPMLPADELKKWRPMAQTNIAAGLHVAQILFTFGEKQRDPKHFREAVALLRPLADRGIPAAQNALGYATLKGLGDIKPDIMAAYVWFNLAAERGHKGAHLNLDQLSKKMTTDQILEGQHRSSTWTLMHTR